MNADDWGRGPNTVAGEIFSVIETLPLYQGPRLLKNSRTKQ